MNSDEIKSIIRHQQNFFHTGATLPIEYRIRSLKKLFDCIRQHEKALLAALNEDLGKCSYESYITELFLCYEEIQYMIKHIGKFSKKKYSFPAPSQFPSINYTIPVPYGTVLVMSPWNYPVLLSILPLVDAISAGNTVVLKPSAYSSNTTRAIKGLIEQCFDPSFVAVITGGREENCSLLNERFDYIFFTGSPSIGREVMSHAARSLTPVTLELGGKSPCIVHSDADIKQAARKIVFGKLLNSGQLCVAPDYVYCHRSVKERLEKELKKQIHKQYGKDVLNNPAYGKIINKKHFDRLSGLLDETKIVYGGRTDPDTLRIEPTLMHNVTFSDRVMQEEIFGPILPILVYDSLDEVFTNLNSMPLPLALYIFTQSRSVANKVVRNCRFGGGCINDTVIHLASSTQPFGGVGESGMSSYHGRAGFDTFSHKKSIVQKYTRLDLKIRFRPYKKRDERFVRRFYKHM